MAPFSVYKQTTHNSSIRSDEGLTLERQLLNLYGGQSTLSTWLNYLLYSPTDVAPQFLQKLTPYILLKEDLRFAILPENRYLL